MLPIETLQRLFQFDTAEGSLACDVDYRRSIFRDIATIIGNTCK